MLHLSWLVIKQLSTLSGQELKVNVNWSRYRPGVTQRVGRGIALLFHDRGTRRGWVVSSTPWPHFTPGKTRYPFYRRLGGPQGRVWTGEKSRPQQDSIPDRPAHSQLLYQLSYPAHNSMKVYIVNWFESVNVTDMDDQPNSITLLHFNFRIICTILIFQWMWSSIYKPRNFVFTVFLIHFSLQPTCNVECAEFFVMNFIIFNLSKF